MIGLDSFSLFYVVYDGLRILSLFIYEIYFS